MYTQNKPSNQFESGQYYWYSASNAPGADDSLPFDTIKINLGQQTYGVNTNIPSKLEIVKFFLDTEDHVTEPVFIKLSIEGISNSAGRQTTEMGNTRQKQAYIFTGPFHVSADTGRYQWDFTNERFPDVIADINYGEITIKMSYFNTVTQDEYPLINPLNYSLTTYLIGLKVY